MKTFKLFNLTKGWQLLALMLLVLVGDTAFAQVQKAFTQRTSPFAQNRKIYNVQGNFTMIGNSNMTVSGGNPNSGSSNSNTYMSYIDVDDVDTTFNSSTAELTLSTENGALPDCSNIVFAGLYWTGRAHNGNSSSTTFSVTKEVPGMTLSNNREIEHEEDVRASYSGFNTGYTMNISRRGNNNNYFPRYTLSGFGLPTIMIEVRNSYPYAWVSYDEGNSFTVIPGQTSTTMGNGGNSRREVNIDPSFVLHSQASLNPFTIYLNQISRDIRTNQSVSGYQDEHNNINVKIEYFGMVDYTKTLNKRKVSIKGPTGGYQTVSASTDDIYYPSGSSDNMYAAYADITSFVQQNGLGNYTVADIALRVGDGESVGYYGGWAMVVVYENSKMNWRDVTIFDGFAYIKSLSNNYDTYYELPVSGFHAAQNGAVNVRLGMIAGEGDRSISGDFFKIRNSADTEWESLSHDYNSTNNFFNSSINTGGGLRIPNHENNTGLDIAMFDLDNTNNELIDNNDTATKFQFGTDQDTYSILAIAFAVDAYVPEVDQINTVASINGQPASGSGTITIVPNDEVGMQLQIKNSGTEAVNNGRIVIPIPFMAEYVSTNAVYNVSPNSGAQPYFDATEGSTGAIIWDIGTIPMPPTDVNGQITDDLFATLYYTFKATDDCSVLTNSNCETRLIVNGGMSGVGATSNTDFESHPFIQGFDTVGNCAGEPIAESLEIDIDVTAFAAANCANTPAIQNFTVCNPVNDEAPISLVAGAFPPGSRFYAEYPVTETTTEYTSANPFPVQAGNNTFYSLAPGDNGCYFEFNIQVTSIEAPVAPAQQSFCASDLPTTSDLAASGSNIKWYANASGGSPLPNATSLTDGLTYYASQSLSSGCESVGRTAVTVSLTTIDPPTGNANQSFCEIDGATVNDLLATGTNVVWYGTANGQTPLATETLLSDGATYYASQNIGTCASVTRLAVTVSINSVAAPSTTETTQTFCEIDGATIADLSATGNNVIWYSDASGGTPMNVETLLSNGATYYASQTVGGCESATRLAVTVTITSIPAPTTTESTQVFCAGNQPTVADLEANGSNLVWYDAPSGGSIVAHTTELVDGHIYYATQETNGCVSATRLAVTATVHPIVTADALNNMVYCATQSTSPIQFTSSVAGTSYTWTNSNTNIGLPASGSGDIAAFQVQNNGTQDEVATIVVTPMANGCAGNSMQFTITVRPQPNGQLLEDLVVCEGTALQLQFDATSGTGPFNLLINGVTFENVWSGVPFAVPTPTPGVTLFNLTQITDANNCVQ